MRRTFEVRYDSKVDYEVGVIDNSRPCCVTVDLPNKRVRAGGRFATTVRYRIRSGDVGKHTWKVAIAPKDLPRNRVELMCSAEFLPRATLVSGRTVLGKVVANRPVHEDFAVLLNTTSSLEAATPPTIQGSDSTAVELLSTKTTSRHRAGVEYISQVSTFRLTVTGSGSSGLHSGVLHVKWAADVSISVPITWVVQPAVEVLPSAVIMSANASESRITLRAEQALKVSKALPPEGFSAEILANEEPGRVVLLIRANGSTVPATAKKLDRIKIDTNLGEVIVPLLRR